tara:strand:+ start:6715 stop:11400 length:4686 start_codon:yes stop_codon:yes gene_type:complete
MKFNSLKEKDKQQLEGNVKYFTNYGQSSARDYVHIYAFDVEDNPIQDAVFPIGALQFNDDGVLVDIGTHLREMGLGSGDYKVQYLFLRRIAGSEQDVFVDATGQVWTHKVNVKVINGQTRYFQNQGASETLSELYPKKLQYYIKEISPNRKEVKVDLQDINNGVYKSDFLGIGKTTVWYPKTTQNAGKIRFDLTDPTILIATFHNTDMGFNDNMVGGQINIPNAFENTVETFLGAPPNIAPPNLPIPDNVPANFVLGAESLTDLFSQTCFHPNTKIKLSNNRSVPIKFLKPGMKVKTEIGFAKIKKVIKSPKPYGGANMINYKGLHVTPGHPIKHNGRWYRADELKSYKFNNTVSDVYNLVLDRGHTIVANNVICATMGKWKSNEEFLQSRNKFRMALNEELFSPSDSDVDVPPTTTIPMNDEFFLDEPHPDPQPLPEVEPIPENTPPAQIQTTQVPRTLIATIVEVLDANRVKINMSYEELANQFNNTGEDRSSDIFDRFYVQYQKQQIQRLNTYMVIGDQYFIVINSKSGQDNDADRTSQIFKLYDKLPNDIEELDTCYFVQEKLEPYTDMVKLVDFVEEDPDVLYLRVPNLNSVDNPIEFRSTQYNTFNDLLGTDDETKQDIKNKLFSGSLLDVQLNIDYQKRTEQLGIDKDDTGFGNFVHFGSAERRIENFKKKLELIQNYTSQSAGVTDVTGSSVTKDRYDVGKNQVINSFDPFEHYMYFESSSYASSSVGQFHDVAVPKHNNSKPYINYHTSHSIFTTWYDNMISSASIFDLNNTDRLVGHLPQHVNTDTQNNAFLDFMDMVGQQFDEVWTYVRHFTDTNERTNKLSEGISKDLVQQVAKSMGMELGSGNDLVIIPEYLLGKGADGSDKYETPQEELTEEIWKRILTNMPFFMKYKGTQRALKGLVNCYGIPSSILRIREFGGPDVGTRVSYEMKRKFSYALDFKSSETVRFPWRNDTESSIKPQTVEFRFRSPKSKDQVILEAEDNWAIALRDNGQPDDYGYVEFALSGSSFQYLTSSLFPVYNDEMWSVMLTRKSASGADLTADTTTQNIKYELTTKQYDSTRQVIQYQDSSSFNSSTAGVNTKFSTSTNFYLGGKPSSKFYGVQFSGSLQEFRLWSEPLSQSVFDNHVRAPKAYNGNTTSSAYDNLIFRLDLGDNINLQSNTEAIDDKSFKNSYGILSGSAVGFTGNSFRSLVDLEQLKVPNIGPNRRNATKIRLESTTLRGNLSPEVRQEQSSQDFAPIDSNKLSLQFSPVDVVNEDIMYSLADFNIDDQIGNPKDEYRYTYTGLDKVQRDYWKKYKSANNFWDYMRIIEYFDQSIWNTAGKLIPARANYNFGLLIEPNILERSKEVVGKKPEVENPYFENANIFDIGVDINATDSGSVQLSGEYPNYAGGINVRNLESGSLGILGLPTLNKINEINPTSEYGNLYATASITFGAIEKEFEETLQPFISSSRLSEHNEIKVPYYTGSLSVSTANGFGEKFRYNGMYQYSSSFERAEFESQAYSTKLFRTFYVGTKTTKKNTIDGKDPVEITITSPTKLVTQEPGDSQLKID